MTSVASRAVRLRIEGRVQAVGYRAWTIETAESLGLRGWVRNRLDGSVEALLVGVEERVAAMIEAARQGPPTARVASVQVVEAEDDGSPRFASKPTA
jgi:acylphosphatase